MLRFPLMAYRLWPGVVSAHSTASLACLAARSSSHPSEHAQAAPAGDAESCVPPHMHQGAPRARFPQAGELPGGGATLGGWGNSPCGQTGHTAPCTTSCPPPPPGHQSATTDPLRRRQPQESARRPVTACHQPVTCAAYISIRSYGAHIRLTYTWSETYLGHLWSSGYDVSLTR